MEMEMKSDYGNKSRIGKKVEKGSSGQLII